MINTATHRLRWAFHYHDHKPSVFGMWDQPAIHPCDMAYTKSRENLLNATIEGKCLKTKKIVCLAQCQGSEFVNFQWIAATSSGFKPSGKKLPGAVIGLMLVTRSQKIQVYKNGLSDLFDHNIDYGKVHLAGFGR